MGPEPHVCALLIEKSDHLVTEGSKRPSRCIKRSRQLPSPPGGRSENKRS